MSTRPDALGLPEAGLPLLRDLVHERTGLFYDNGRYETLAERLGPLVVERGFSSYLDFYYLLKYDAGGAAEWCRVLDALSVQETYFFREVDQIRAIACHVVPDLFARHPGRPVRIWSVPCATGEEPLSIAMVLEESGVYQRGEVEIHASDGSPSAIAKAQRAQYRNRSFRATPPHLATRYFTEERGVFTPKPELQQRVTSWSVVNLMTLADAGPLATCEIVFCRNAFIYFSPQSVGRVVSMLADFMPTPGYLCVGASESLLNITNRFTLEDIGDAFVYVKR